MSDNYRMSGDSGGGAIASIAAGFMVGAIVGAGVALLMAPTSGRQTRQRLGDLTDRVSGTMRDGLNQARDKMTSLKREVETRLDGDREPTTPGQASPEPRFNT